MDKGLEFVICALIVLGIGIAVFERKTLTAHEIALTAFLVSLAALGRVAFAFIPSAKPTTFVVIMSGVVFGPTIGFLVGAFGAFVSNFFLGQGPWTIMQMLAWGLCGISAGLLSRFVNIKHRPALIIFGGVWGFLFGWIMNFWYWLSFIYPLTWASWFATNVASFWFDLMHASINVLFLYFFSQDFIKILERFKNKMRYEVIKKPSQSRGACVFLITVLIVSSMPMPVAQAGEVILPLMPKPGTTISLSQEFAPAHLTGITIHSDNALQFDFLIHKGDGNLDDAQKREEYSKLIKYFLASLTIPDGDQWVNLSPYEKDRIIEDNFGKTEMGRDLLSQDYLLKQLTSSLMYPEQGLGKKFWDRVYERAWREYHTTNIPVNTFNKVWIVPDEAVVYERGNTAYILKSHLKIMLEEDYLAIEKNQRQPGDMSPKGPCPQAGCRPLQELNGKAPQGNHQTHSMASQIVRELILPEIEKEVNEGKNFAMLRQIYSGMILATWYKKALKESLLGKIYADKNKVNGLQPTRGHVPEGAVSPSNDTDLIYQQYLKAFKKGAYNYIKEDHDKYSRQTIARKYFSGGLKRLVDADGIAADVHVFKNPAQLTAGIKMDAAQQPLQRGMIDLVSMDLQEAPQQPEALSNEGVPDGAMMSKKLRAVLTVAVLTAIIAGIQSIPIPSSVSDQVVLSTFNIKSLEHEKASDIDSLVAISIRFHDEVLAGNTNNASIIGRWWESLDSEIMSLVPRKGDEPVFKTPSYIKYELLYKAREIVFLAVGNPGITEETAEKIYAWPEAGTWILERLLSNPALPQAFVQRVIANNPATDSMAVSAVLNNPSTPSDIKRKLQDAIENLKKRGANPAMLNSNTGGIDLNASNFNLNIKRDGKGVALPLTDQDVAHLQNIQGFTPLIIAIKPITALPILSELKPSALNNLFPQ